MDYNGNIYVNLNLYFFLNIGSEIKERSKSVHARYDLIRSFNLKCQIYI